ncbi:DUF3168 domain-containing protein [Novosphingobium sp. FGD1]|uniref:DUF3168 domain-containing protein n=1 Tax=Novosphingobium silvae TaxID=2692619 RepID=A0A7X4GFY9_9SPHN|nr:DUF3168 domain-containing protein [Novosphingobium silvae]MYL97067.1 DUF3168 domain-containing protein [Novosphingobium silvae]
MANDILRATERACIVCLKADAPLAAIIAKTSIDPQPGTAGVDVDGYTIWPFITLEGTQAIPSGRGCSARSDVTFQLHSFAKARKNSAGAMIETARDHAGKINTAVVEAIHNHAFTVAGRRYKFAVTSSRLMKDGGESDAYHGIAFVRARAFQG